MPLYDYICHDCEDTAKRNGVSLEGDNINEVIFETYHTMDPTATELKKATECPRCNGHRTEKYLMNNNITCYMRGNGWLDVPGRNRDMNLYKLQNDDPYGYMRETGEADDLAIKLKKAGQHNPKTQHFLTK